MIPSHRYHYHSFDEYASLRNGGMLLPGLREVLVECLYRWRIRAEVLFDESVPRYRWGIRLFGAHISFPDSLDRFERWSHRIVSHGARPARRYWQDRCSR